MKKTLFVCATLMAAVAFVSCNSSKESAYRKAYEKAQAQAQAQAQSQQPQYQTTQQAPVVTPLEQPGYQQQGYQQQGYQQQGYQQQPGYQQQGYQQGYQVPSDNVSVRSENVSVVSGRGLKAYSVVVGSFGVRANAEGLQSTLNRAGYDAQVAYNAERNMYRVIVSTFDNKESAIQSRNSIRSTYPDAWLLFHNR
jgi:cell division protein FtsN